MSQPANTDDIDHPAIVDEPADDLVDHLVHAALDPVTRAAVEELQNRDDRVDTRSRIQQVALELFTEQGYEATSLREIAERLGVTKAALYYHFHTKEEIVQSLFQDHLAELDALIAWGRQQPPSVETRREFVRRYADLLEGRRHFHVMRLFERNQPSMQKHQAGATIKDRLAAIQTLLSTPDAKHSQQLRRSLAIMALHTAWFTLCEPDFTDQERRAAALEVALELVE